MNICSVCGEYTKQGNYTRKKNLFICNNCSPLIEELYVDSFKMENGEVITISPFSDVEEATQRWYFIDYCYRLFNQKLHVAAYALMKNYIKRGYSWLGMIRAMEYFYVIKKNSTAKANNNIGIIPYTYGVAADYFDYLNSKNYKNFKMNYGKVVEMKKEEIEFEEKPRLDKIDLNTL